MQQIMCPFFREECLRERCTAFVREERLVEIIADNQPQFPFTIEQAKQMPHPELYICKVNRCNALDVELPEGR